MTSKIEVPSEFPGKFANKSPTQIFFDSTAKKDVDRAHWKIAFWSMVGVSIILTLTIFSITPLKTVKIYRLEVDKSGARSVVPMSSEGYLPSENEVRARMKELVERLVAIDPRLLKKNLTKVESMMSGQARQQFREYLSNEKVFARIVKTPNLFREVQVSAVSKIEEKVFLVDFITKERIGEGEPTVKRRTMTMSYEIEPAKTDEEVLGDNPAGIYIVSFTISDIN